MVVTGASGFIGRELCAALAASGAEVVALTGGDPQAASRSGLVAGRILRWRLGQTLPGGWNDGDVPPWLVHLGWPTRGCAAEQWRAAAATAALFAAGRQGGVERVVFVSSLAAGRDAPGAYGRAKWHAERALDGTPGLVVRPGLVLGTGGLAGRLRASLRRFPVAPDVRGAALAVVGHADLVRAMVAAVAAGQQGTLPLARPEAVAWRDIVSALAAAEGRRVRFVPLPRGLTSAAVGLALLAERMHLRLPFASDNLRSLLDPPPPPTAADLAATAAMLRPWPALLGAIGGGVGALAG